MRRFFKSTSFKIFSIVIAALFIGTVVAAVSHGNCSPLTSAAGTIFGPVQRLSSFVSKSLSSFAINFKSSAVLAEQVSSLEEEIAKYRKDLVGYEQAKQQLALYEEFLELKKEHEDYEFVSASIIGRDPTDLFYTFILNKGTSNDVSVNDPVLYGKYLVGVVTSVSVTQCTVSSVLNPQVSASAYEVRSRESGFVETTAELSKQGLLRLPGLDRTTAISPGGIVCTSGTGGIYPRDLIIGMVREVVSGSQDISSYAVIEPGVDFTQLQDVFILVDFEGQSSAAEDDG